MAHKAKAAVVIEAGNAPTLVDGAAAGRRIGRGVPPNFLFRPVQTRLLVDLLPPERRPKVVAMVAPVGYGKTVMMTALFAGLQTQGEHCFWTTLDERDNTVERVVRQLEDMAYRHSERLHPTQALFRGDEPMESRIDDLVEAAINYGAPFTAFVDNLDSCSDEALAHVFDRLIFETPPTVRFVLSSTTELPLNQARAKLEGLVRQVGYTELSLAPDEVAELLGLEVCSAIGAAGVDAVTRETEGWPAAVRLAQIVLAAAENPRAVLQHFSGSDEDLASLLNRQVLSGFEQDVREFLLQIALLRNFSADLCRHVTGSDKAERYLALLLRRNVFVIPVDRNRSWYRLHGLFRQYLRSEAERQLPPAYRQQVLARAAAWCEQGGYWRDAIDYALAAGETEMACGILERTASGFVRDRGDVLQYIAWAETVVEQRHALGWEADYWYVWALVLSRRYDTGRQQIERLARRIDAAVATGNAARQLADLRRRLDIIRVCLDIFTDRLADAHRNAAGWLQNTGSDDPFDVTAAWCTESIYLASAFQFADARDAVQAAQAAAYQTRSVYAKGWIIALHALPPILEGNYTLIQPELGAALGSLRGTLGDGAGICGTIALLGATCAVEMDEIDEARSLLLQGMRTSEGHGFVDAVACGFDAAVKLWSGVDDEVISLLHLRELAHSYPPRLAFMLSCFLVRRLVCLGRMDEAMGEAARLGFGIDAPAMVPRSVTVARSRDAFLAAAIDLFLASGRSRFAEALIAEENRLARAEGRFARQVELALAETVLAVQAGNHAAGSRHITRAVSLAAHRGIVRPFRAHAEAVAAIVEDTKPGAWGFAMMQERRFFADVCRQLPISDRSLQERLVALNMESQVLDPLTRRQIELLGLLDAGLSNQQIADRIHVTLTTVKGHLQKLYAKLGVSSRGAALARARALKLLS